MEWLNCPWPCAHKARPLKRAWAHSHPTVASSLGVFMSALALVPRNTGQGNGERPLPSLLHSEFGIFQKAVRSMPISYLPTGFGCIAVRLRGAFHRFSGIMSIFLSDKQREPREWNVDTSRGGQGLRSTSVSLFTVCSHISH